MMPNHDKNKPTLQENIIELQINNIEMKILFLNVSYSISKTSSNNFILVL